MTSLVDKAADYEVTAAAIDGMDLLAVKAAAEMAVTAIRAGEVPYFLDK